MRKGIGCAILLASVILSFTALGSVLVAEESDPGVPINFTGVGIALIVAFIGYCVGLNLLTAIRSDGPRRGLFRRRT